MESFGFLMLCLALVSMASCQSKTAGDFPTVMTWYQYAGLTVSCASCALVEFVVSLCAVL